MNLRELIENGAVVFEDTVKTDFKDGYITTVDIYVVPETLYTNEYESEDDEGNEVTKDRELITKIEYLVTQIPGEKPTQTGVYVYTMETDERDEADYMALTMDDDLDISWG